MAEEKNIKTVDEKEQDEKREAEGAAEPGESPESSVLEESERRKFKFSFRLVAAIGLILLVVFFVVYKITNMSLTGKKQNTTVSGTAAPKNPSPFEPTTSPTLREAQEKEIELMKKRGELFLSTDFGGVTTEEVQRQKEKEVRRPKPEREKKKVRKEPTPQPPEVRPQPRVIVQPPSQEELLKERMWESYLTQKIGLGGFVPVGGSVVEASVEGTGNVQSQSSVAENTNVAQAVSAASGGKIPFFRYEPYCFVPAVVEVGGDTLPGTGNVVVARVTRGACGVPANSRLVGKPVFVAYRNRASIRFTRIKTPDGGVYAILGDAYMADESPGVASVVVHNDRKRAVFQSVSKGIAAAADAASQEPTDEKCYYMDEGVVVCEEDQKKPKPKKVFLREFSANMADNTDVFFPNVAQVPKIVKIEKGLPIKVLLLEPELNK